MIYKFKSGINLRGVDPQSAGEELRRIRDVNGGLRPDEVLTEASDKASMLHPIFTWDNETAGHQYRLWEARQIINHVVVIESEGDEPKKAFYNVVVHLPDGEIDRYYQSADIVAKNPMEYHSALMLLRQDLAGCQKTITQLMDLAPRSEKRRVRAASRHIDDAQRTLTP